MPTLNINKEQLFKALGCRYSDDEFSELCFSFGLELDEIVSEKPGGDSAEKDEIIYKIDIPANRYDLLCLEGLSTALLIFLKKRPVPVYKRIVDADSFITVENKPNTKRIRPFILAAVLRNVSLNQESYNSFIDLQDKLHHNICRKRTLVAIGTHDLDTITPPVIYDAKPPNEIRFRALNQDREHTAAELMEIYATHAQLKQYVPIIKDSPVYPVVLDSKGTVLSLPPIINGNHSKISVNTKNIFIECTATDLTKAVIVLDTLVCAFSSYCKEPFSVECCKVVNENSSKWYPLLEYRKKNLSVKQVNKYLGLKIETSEMVSLLNQMSLETSENDKCLTVKVPPTRHDIIHACDIIEDVAIAVGYNAIPKVVPNISTVANQLPLNKLTEQLRHHVAYSGFAEALTFSLCSRDDIGCKLKKDIKTLPAVHVSNPKTLEFQVVRTTLLPGLLKTVSSNKQLPLPIKLFEISDAVYKTKEAGVGARNERYLCAVYYGKTSGFEIIHGLLDKVMQLLTIPKDVKNGYSIRCTNDSSFFPERCAEIFYMEKKIGILGILHPEVITEFDLSLPCSCLEFSIEPFV